MQNNKYSIMQKTTYEREAQNWSLENKDPVVGSFNEHNNWSDYEEFLFKDIADVKNKTVIDFGCGPGRNLVKFAKMVKKIDGVDISTENLKNARKWIEANSLDLSNFDLYENDGFSLSNVPSNKYDVAISTICFQHICVYDIRFHLLKEIFRILKSGGKISFQMGFGSPSPSTVDYYANFYDARKTNRGCDTEIKSTDQIENDLKSIGFVNFNYYIRPVGPGDGHPNWIFFNAQKP